MAAPSRESVLGTAGGAEGRGGAYVEVPSAVVDELGGGKRIPVLATFDGIEYRGSIVSMGGGRMILGVLKSIRTSLGKEPGDVLSVTVDRDTRTRTVSVPADLAAALAESGVRPAFDALELLAPAGVRAVDRRRQAG